MLAPIAPLDAGMKTTRQAGTHAGGGRTGSC